jgi:hypothetical protein
VEDTTAVNEQLKWLNGLSTSERNLVIIASHDDELHKELEAKKLLGAKLE